MRTCWLAVEPTRKQGRGSARGACVMSIRSFAKRLPTPRAGTALPATWPRRFLASVEDDRLHPLWLLIATSGMRRGEALGLMWRDIDLDAARVSVTRTLVQVRGKLAYSTPKTDKGR